MDQNRPAEALNDPEPGVCDRAGESRENSADRKAFRLLIQSPGDNCHPVQPSIVNRFFELHDSPAIDPMIILLHNENSTIFYYAQYIRST